MIAQAIAVIALPAVAFAAGLALLARLSDRARVAARLQGLANPRDRRPLHLRLHYDAAAVARHWGALDAAALAAEHRFLTLDLLFPFLYGAAFAASGSIAWAALQRPVVRTWLLASIGILMISDWIENLVLIGQIRHFTVSPRALQPRWIAVASLATLLKLTFVAIVVILLAILAWLTAIRQRA